MTIQIDARETNKFLEEAVQFWNAVFNDGSLAPINRENFDAKYEFCGEPQTLDELKAWCAWLVNTYDKHHVEVNTEVSFACGKQVALYWEFTGMLNGLEMSTTGVNLIGYSDDGKCLTNWQVASNPAMLTPQADG